MDKIILFLKPTIKKVVIGLLIWVGLRTFAFFGFYACVYGDCIRDGHMASCCGPVMSLIGYVFAYLAAFCFRSSPTSYPAISVAHIVAGKKLKPNIDLRVV